MIGDCHNPLEEYRSQAASVFLGDNSGGEIQNPLLEDHHGDSGHEISPFFWVDLITTEAVVLPKPNGLSWFNLGKSSPFMAELCRLVTYYNLLVVWNIWIIFPYIGNNHPN